MKVLYSKKIRDNLEALKYAYSFMSSKYLYKKECSFVNPNPTLYDEVHVFARDSISLFYNENNMPNWDCFKENKEHFVDFMCVGAVDELDNCRVNCSLLGDSIVFTCYGDYEKLAKEAMESIIKNQSRLK